MPSLVPSEELGGEVPEGHHDPGGEEVELGFEVRAGTPRSRPGAGRGCRGVGTSRRCRCTRRRGSCPMPSMRRVSSWPARPTNGMPWRSSSAPGPSPTKTRSACGAPTPKTTWVRVSASGHLVQPAASAASSAERAPRSDRVERRHGCSSSPGATASRTAAAVTSVAATRSRSRCAVDGTGGEGDDEVPVVAGVRRVDRPGQPVVGALGEEEALGFRAAGVGGHDDEGGVGLRGVERLRVGKRGRVGGALDPARSAPVESRTSPRAFTTAERADGGVVDRGARRPEPARRRVLGAAPLPDGGAAARRRPARWSAARRGRPPRPPRSLRGRAGSSAPGGDEVVDRGGRDDRDRARRGSGSRVPGRRASSSPRRRPRARTPSRR